MKPKMWWLKRYSTPHLCARYLMLFCTVGFILLPTSYVWANPAGEQVVGGAATFQRDGNKLTVNQATDRLAVNWQSFNIGAGESTHFNMPSSTSAALNRVIGGNPSSIYGSLSANGILYLINPSGILVGPGGTVNAAAFMASTLDVSTEQFMNAKNGAAMNFYGSSGESIINQGNITAEKGDVFLVAQKVENRGTINAANGTAGMVGSGQNTDVMVHEVGGKGFAIRVAQLQGEAATGSNRDLPDGEELLNEGSISAAQAELNASGNVYALAIRNSGTIRAKAVVANADGTVRLDGGLGDVMNTGTMIAKNAGDDATAAGGKIDIAGQNITASPESIMTAAGGEQGGNGGSVKIDSQNTTIVQGKVDVTAASAGAKGGKVQLLGEKVGMLDGAKVDASGGAGGGTVLVGGDYLGGQTPRAEIKDLANQESESVKNAKATVMADTAEIKADATVSGDGGKVILWSDEYTGFYGQLFARGGAEGGNGGFIETSSKNNLQGFGSANAAAANGKAGLWLLDPANVNIAAVTANGAFSGGNPNVFTPTADSATINVATIANALLTANVVINTEGAGTQNGVITLSSALTVGGAVTGNETTLSLNAGTTGAAGGTITINNTITGFAGNKLNVVLNAAGGAVTLGNFAMTTQGGSLAVNAGGNVNLNGAVTTGGGQISVVNTLPAGSVTLGATGSLTSGGGNILINTGSGGITLTGATSSGSGNVNLNVFGAGAVSIGTLGTANGNLAVAITGNGAITQTGAITTGSGTASFTTTGAVITLGNAGNLFGGAVSLRNTGGNAVSLVNNSALVMGTVNVGGTLGLGFNGNLTQLAGTIITTAGVTTLTATGAGRAVMLAPATGSAANSFGANFLFSGASNIQDFSLRNLNGITITELSELSSLRNLTVTFDSGNMTLPTFSASGDVALTTSAGANTIELNNVSVGGNFTVAAGGGTGGAISQTANTTIVTGPTAVTTLSAGSGGIVLAQNGNDFKSTVNLSTAAGGLANITDLNAIVLGAVSINGVGALTVTGDSITQATTGSITTGSGAITMNGQTGVITLANSGNNFGTSALSLVNQGSGATTINYPSDLTLGSLNLGSGGLTVTSSGNLNLGTGTVAGPLNATASNANITQGGAGLTVTGLSTLAAGSGNITLASTGNTFGNVTINSATDVTFANAATTAGTTLFPTLPATLGNLTLSFANSLTALPGLVTTGNLTVTSGLNLTQSAALTVGGAASFNSTSGLIDLTTSGASNNFGTSVALTTSGANNISITDAGALILGNISMSALSAGTLTVNAGGNLTQVATGITTGTGSVTLNLGSSGNINLDNVANFFNGNVNFTGSYNDITVRDSTSFAIQSGLNVPGSFSLTVLGGNSITQLGALTIVGAGSFTASNGALGGSILLTNAGNNFGTSANLTNLGANDISIVDVGTLVLGSVSMAASAGALTVQAGGNLTQLAGTSIIAGTGAVSLTANAGGSIILAESANNFRGNVTFSNGLATISLLDTSSFQIQNGLTLAAGGSFTLTAAGVSQDGAMSNTSGITTLTSTGAANDILLTSAANDFSTVLLTSGRDAAIVDANSVNIGTSDVTRDLSVTATAAGGNTIVNAPVTVGGNAVFTAGTTGLFQVNTTGSNNGSLGVTGNVTVTSSTIDLQGALAGANVFLLPSTDATTVGINASSTFSLTTSELLNIVSGGTVTVGRSTGTGAITVGGLGAFDLSAASYDLTLEGLTSAIAFSNGITMGNGRTLNLAAGGAVTSSATGTDITVGDGFNNGILSISSASTVGISGNALSTAIDSLGASTIGTTFLSNSRALQTTGAIGVTGNLTLTTGGTVSQTIAGAVTVSGVTVITVPTGSDVLLGTAANNFGAVTLTASGGSTFRDLELRNASASASVPTVNATRNVLFNFDNAGVDLPTLTLTGTLDVIAGGGPITQTGILNITGDSSFASTGFGITLGNIGNIFGSNVSLTTTGLQNATLVDSTALVLGTSNVSALLDLTSGGSITQATGTTLTTGAGVTTSFTTVTSDLLLTGLNSIAGQVAFGGTLTNIRDVSIQNSSTGAQVPVLEGLTNLRDLTLNYSGVTAFEVPTLQGFASLRNISFSTAGPMTQKSGGISNLGTAAFAVTLANTITLTDVANNFGEAVSLATSGGNAFLTESNGLVVGTMNLGAGDLTIVTNAGSITDSGVITANDLNITSAGSVLLDQGHAVDNLAANVTGAGQGFTFANTTVLTVDTINGISGITTAAGATSDINVSTTTGDLTVGSAITAGTGADVTLVNNDASFNPGSPPSLNINANINVSGAGSASLRAAGDVNVAAGFIVGGDVTRTGTISLNADTDGNGAGGLTIAGTLGNATSTSTITLTGATLTMAATGSVLQGNGTVVLKPSTSSVGLGLGAAGGFNVTQAVLDQILSTGVVEVGSSDYAGTVTLGNLSLVNTFNTLRLLTALGTTTSLGAATFLTSRGIAFDLNTAMNLGGFALTVDTTQGGLFASGASVTFGQTIGNGSISVAAGTGGNVTFSGAVGVPNAVVNALQVSSANNITLARGANLSGTAAGGNGATMALTATGAGGLIDTTGGAIVTDGGSPGGGGNGAIAGGITISGSILNLGGISARGGDGNTGLGIATGSGANGGTVTLSTTSGNLSVGDLNLAGGNGAGAAGSGGSGGNLVLNVAAGQALVLGGAMDLTGGTGAGTGLGGAGQGMNFAASTVQVLGTASVDTRGGLAGAGANVFATDGNLTFGRLLGSADGSGQLSLNVGNGNITFGIIGTTAVPADQALDRLTIANANLVTFSGTVRLGTLLQNASTRLTQNTVLNGSGQTEFQGAVTLINNGTAMNLTGYNFTIGNTLATPNGGAVIVNNNALLNIAGVMTLGGSFTQAAGVLAGAVPIVNLGANLNLGGGIFTLASATRLGTDVTINTGTSGGSAIFNGTLDSDGTERDLTISGSGTVQLNNRTGSLANLDAVSTGSSSRLEFGTLAAGTVIAPSLQANSVTSSGVMGFGAGTFYLSAGGFTFNHESTPGLPSVDGSGATLTLSGPVTIGNKTEMNLTELTLLSAVNGDATVITDDLLLNLSGLLNLYGKVGAATALDSFNLTGATQINLFMTGATKLTPSIQTVGSQYIAGDLVLHEDAVLSSTGIGVLAGDFDFINTVDSFAANDPKSFEVYAGGKITLEAAAGGGTRLKSAILESAGELAVNAGINTFGGDINLTSTASTVVLAGATATTGDANQLGGAVNLDGAKEVIFKGGTITTFGGAVRVIGPASINTATAITTSSGGLGDGDVTFDGTLNGFTPLTVTAGTGALTFTGAVGGTNPFGMTVSSSGGVTFSQAVRMGGAFTFNQLSGPFLASSSISGAFGLTVNPVNSGATLTFQEVGTKVVDGVETLVPVASLTIGNGNSAVFLNGNITTSGGVINFGSPVTANESIVLNTTARGAVGGGISFLNTLKAGTDVGLENLTITAGRGGLTFGDAITGFDEFVVNSAGSMDFTSNGSVSAGVITLNTDVTAQANVVLSTTRGDLTILGGLSARPSNSSGAGAIAELVSAGAISISGLVNVSGRSGTFVIFSPDGSSSTTRGTVGFRGGEVNFTAASDISIGSLNANGGNNFVTGGDGGDGGIIELTSGGKIQTSSIQANGGSDGGSGGKGGTVNLVRNGATGDFSVSTISAVGGDGDDIGGDGGNITLTAGSGDLRAPISYLNQGGEATEGDADTIDLFSGNGGTVSLNATLGSVYFQAQTLTLQGNSSISISAGTDVVLATDLITRTGGVVVTANEGALKDVPRGSIEVKYGSGEFYMPSSAYLVTQGGDAKVYSTTPGAGKVTISGMNTSGTDVNGGSINIHQETGSELSEVEVKGALETSGATPVLPPYGRQGGSVKISGTAVSVNQIDTRGSASLATATAPAFGGAGGDVAITGTTITITSGTSSTGTAVSIDTSGGTGLGVSNATGGAGGSISLNGNVVLNSGDSTRTTVILNTQGGAFAGGASNGVGGNIAVTGSLTGTKSTSNTLDLRYGSGTVTLGSTAADTITLGTLITAADDARSTGNLIINGELDLGTLTTYARGYSIEINGGGTIANSVTFNNTGNVALGNSDPLIITTFSSGVDSTAPATSELKGTIISGTSENPGQGTPLSFGAATLVGNTTLDSNGSNVSLGTIDGPFNLIFASGIGSGVVDITSAVGASSRVGAITVSLGITQPVLFRSSVTAEGLVGAADTTIIFDGNVDLTEGANLLGLTKLNNTLYASQNTTFSFTIGANSTLNDVELTLGPILINGLGDYSFTGLFDGAQNLTLSGIGTKVFSSTVGGTDAIGTGTGAAITMSGGDVTFGALTTASGLASTTADVIFNGIATLGAGDTGTTLDSNVTLSGATISSAGSVALGSDVGIDTITLDAGTVTLTGSGAYTMNVEMTGGQRLVLGGAGTKTFMSTANVTGFTQDDLSGTVTFQDDVTTSGVSLFSASTVLNNIKFTASGIGALEATAMNEVTLNGEVTLQGVGNYLFNGAMTGDQTTFLHLSSTGTSTFESTVTVNSVDQLVSAGTATFRGDVTTGGESSFNGATVLDGMVFSAGDLTTMNGVTLSAGAVTLQGAGAYSIGGAVAGSQNMILAGNGAKTFDGTVSVGSALLGITQADAIGNTVLFNNTVTTAGVSTFNRGVTLGAMTFNSGGATTMNDLVTLAGDATLQGAGSYTVNGAVGGGKNLTLAEAGTKAFNSTLNLGTFSQTGGKVSLGGGVTTSGAVNLATVGTTGDILVNSTGATQTYGSVTLAGDLTTATTSGDVDAVTFGPGGVTGAGNLNVQAASLALNGVVANKGLFSAETSENIDLGGGYLSAIEVARIASTGGARFASLGGDVTAQNLATSTSLSMQALDGETTVNGVSVNGSLNMESGGAVNFNGNDTYASSLAFTGQSVSSDGSPGVLANIIVPSLGGISLTGSGNGLSYSPSGNLNVSGRISVNGGDITLDPSGNFVNSYAGNPFSANSTKILTKDLFSSWPANGAVPGLQVVYGVNSIGQVGANQIGVSTTLLAGNGGPFILEFTTGTGQPYILAQQAAIPPVMLPATVTGGTGFAQGVTFEADDLEMMTPEERSAYESQQRQISARVILQNQSGGAEEIGAPTEGRTPQAANPPAQLPAAPTAQVLLQGKPLAQVKTDQEKGDASKIIKIRPARAVGLREADQSLSILESERLAAEVSVGSAPVVRNR